MNRPRSRTPESRSPIVMFARVAYIIVLLLATLVPFALELSPAAIASRLVRALDPSLTARDVIDAARNLTLFAGWGALWIATSAWPKRSDHAIRTATLTGLALSVLVETLQLLSAYRHASILDIATNTVGALGGALTIVWLTQALTAARGRKSYLGIPAFIFALSYLLAVLLEAFGPLLRQLTLPGAAGGPIARFALALDHFSLGTIFDVPAFDIVLFLPLGVFGVTLLAEMGRKYGDAARLTSAAGFAVAMAGEVAHGFLGQPISLGPVVAHTFGTALGAWLASVGLPPFSRRYRGASRLRVFYALYAVLVVLWAWRPFLPETNAAAIAEQLSLGRWLPLQAHRPRFDFYSVADVMKPFFLYLPLGSLLRGWPLQLKGGLPGFLPAAYFALALELGQIFVAGRYFDVTDVLVAAAGSAIGWTVAHKAGYRPYGQVLTRV